MSKMYSIHNTGPLFHQFWLWKYFPFAFFPNFILSLKGTSEGTVVMECLMIRNVVSSTQGSFRGGLSASPQRSSASPRRRPDENAVVHFFRNIVSPSTPKSRREQKSQSSTKGQKGRGDTLTRIFKSGGSKPASSTKR
uniref:Myelin basic protein n=1 Tax=Cyprinus carpio TaxID=7962 RepID=A0A8C2C7N4_CYPCA